MPLPVATTAPIPTATGEPDAPAQVHASDEGPSRVIADETVLPGTALELLATLPVKGRAPKTGYDREGHFGEAWLDVDRNGCDTRNDILARDLIELRKDGDCVVLSGRLEDKYTGTTIDFERGPDTSTAVQIDHVVALMDAWQSGAQQLTQAQRVSLANDPLNLMAVDGSANQQKGASNAASWLPPNRAFRCEYVARQVSVKARYGLWVTEAERDAIQRVLGGCAKQPAPTGAFAAVSQTVASTDEMEPAESVAPVTVDQSVFYANCAAARAAGAAPIRAGDPGYGAHLDRDLDGIGCET